MKAWLLFILFLIVGVGMFIGGLRNMRKEKDDAESVKIYRIVSVIGAVLTVGAILVKFVL